MIPLNIWHVYIRNGYAFVPTVARTDAGFFLDIDPVAMLAENDRESLIQAIVRSIATGNPLVPTPARSAYQTPAVVRAAGVKTWSTFEKGARCYTLYRTEREFEIPVMERAEDGWMENRGNSKKFLLSSSHEEVARALVEQMGL
jgi:hypothetical protein